MKEEWANSLHESKDGAALKSSSSESSSWVAAPDKVSSKLFRRGFKLRSNLMTTRARQARWKSSAHEVKCRHGCPSIESLQHIIQRCHYTHSSRVYRHDRVVKRLVKIAERHNRKVLVEPQIPLAPTYIKPDIILIHNKHAVVIDVQVCGDVNAERAFSGKVKKYGSPLCHSRILSFFNTVGFEVDSIFHAPFILS